MTRNSDRLIEFNGAGSPIGRSPFLTTSLFVPGQIALAISWGRGFLYGYRETDTVITMARFRTLSARRNAMISAAQRRSARALLGWAVAKLASAASVSASAIDDFEAERRAPIPAVAGPIRRAFEPGGGAVFSGGEVRARTGAAVGGMRHAR